ncbi:hypothetical protein AT959_06835 [Dechloromonas denitrificans]|uniref:Uncharacterized protein n=1 Tax=Dechloromonas denitrificans TaxID=281362 RepID=A0A133XKB2_9RHOO|nr:hypothetical protein [Dechloromonas denitrificans]KXB31379.1 hypothetical protein AT959_06835 [Dechloromonas denitrificans]
MPGKNILLLRVVMFCVGAVSVLAAAFLLLHHPMRSDWLLGSLCFAAFFTAALYPPLVFFLVPTLLPVVDLAPWTGWITFEEFDLLVLLLLGGAYLRHALTFPWLIGKNHRLKVSWGTLLLLAMLGSVLISLFRGLAESGGFSFSWFHGYYQSMNSIRLAKPFLLAVLLLPLCLVLRPQEKKGVSCFSLLGLGLGMTAGLCLVSLATIWERVAFLGLLDFSSDYRTTALFWEMHVGGAALDGFLALTVPFAARELIFAKSRWHLAFVLAALALASYACLTTFSRGVYAAIPIALGLSIWLSMREIGSANLLLPVKKSALAVALFGMALFTIAAYWVFETSGYRGMFVFLVASGLFYPVGLALASVSSATWWRGISLGLLSSMIGLALAISVPKGAYLVFAVSALLTAGSLIGRRQRVSAIAQGLLIPAYVSMLSSGVLVAWHWGGNEAIASMAISCTILLCGIFVASRRTLPQCGFRSQLSIAVVLALLAAVVAIFSGGRYMADRFSTTNKDLDYRLQHWETGLGQLQGADWWLGKGLGRVPATYFFAAPQSEYPGGFHLQSDSSGNTYLRLVGGRHINGWGEVFRVTQRIRPEPGVYRVQFNVRAEKDVIFVFEVCAKHLLYQGRCVARQVEVKGEGGTWQRMEVELQGDLPGGGAWYAPELVVFSIAMLSRGGVADFDNLALQNNGMELLANGNFDSELTRWFSSSDKYHMPWHMKNVFLHILFEQGGLGLVVLLVMLASAFFRLVWGKAASHPLAPAVAGGLAGFCIVGVFDSLLDVPRVATLFYLLLLLGLFIRRPNSEH